MPVYIYLAAIAIAVSIPLLLWSLGGVREASVARVRTMQPAVTRADLREMSLARPTAERLLDPVVDRLSGMSHRLTPHGMTKNLGRRIQQAGLAGKLTLDMVLVGKLVLLVGFGGMGALMWLSSPSAGRLLFALVMGGLGWFAPDLILHGRAQERQQKLGEELPEILDQMTVSVEAGLGFEAALARVVEEGGSVLSEEFGRALQDIRLGVSRERALMRVLDRNDSPDLKHFVLMLGQADRLGVPLANVLRVLADEMRERRRTLAQERAMKVPAKLVFPLVLCVLPALFVAILGPAILKLVNDGFL